ncbi:Uncharacterized protein FWK35_00002310 [Aphis craccivora]|uniref:Uncharacterized protein n=1 Tax=Aphis craccivora TaxID=307492 RepID=A0A6G0ZBV2_APHCR|nr:Uncharacterized protein FWK35_00002310 [Aphis craccivora]
MFFFYVCVQHITCRNNASISKFRGGFRWQSKYPWTLVHYM